MNFFKILRYYIAAMMLLNAGIVNAQEKNPLINSGEVIRTGSKLHDEKKYKEAIVEYNKVDRSDTNYVDALYELSYSYYADSQMNKSLECAKLGLTLFPKKYSSFSLQAANALDEMGKHDEALTLYSDALKRSPNSFLLYFNKGVVNYRKENYEEAKKNFQQCILINPYYTSAQYFLGKVYMLQGNLVPALMAFNTYLLMAPSGKYYSNVITALSSITKVSDEVLEYVKNKPAEREDNFTMQQDILLSKLALDKQYKLKADLEDNIVRQMQVVYEKLEYNKNDKGFCMQYYLPFFINLVKDGDFEATIFITFSGINNKKIEEWNKDNKKERQAFIDKASAYFDGIKRTQVLDPDERKRSDINYVYNNQVYIGRGAYTDLKTYQNIGKWEYYFDNGEIKARGNFNDAGKKDGEWIYYHDNGVIKEKARFANGELNGITEGWSDNGNKWYIDTYQAGKLNGPLTGYYYNENKKNTVVYKDDLKNGEERLYDYKGTLTAVINYVDDKLEGWYKRYYPNGKISSEVLYKNDKEEGTYKSYYNSGKLYLEGTYKDGLRQGEWKTYFEDGKLSEKTVYIDNDITGEFTEYFSNGKLKRKGNYYKKKIDGKIENYDDDGIKYSDIVYEKGKLKEISFYDKNGNTVSTTTTRKGAANIIFYSSEAVKSSEGYFTKNGDKDGKFVNYYTSGKISDESNWKEGVKDGPQTSYYADGKIYKMTNFTNDMEDGYVKDFYANGQISSEGWKIDGKRQQNYMYYNVVGDLTAKEYFLNDEQNGYSVYYEPGNIRRIEYLYKNGWLMSTKQFDTTGKIIHSNNFEKGNGKIIYKHYNGKISSEGNYQHYMLNGAYNYYFFDGSLYTTSFYKNDERDSIYRSYYWGGVLNSEGTYKAGSKEGKWKYYFPNGKIMAEEYYLNGELQGVNKTYYIDGSLARTVSYKDNEFDGPLVIYGEKNQLAVRLNYKNGIIKSYQYEEKPGILTTEIPVKNSTGLISAKYPNGKQSVLFNMVENKVEGSRKIFYSNGNIFIDCKRLNGENDGVFKTYHPDGSLWEEEQYVLGNLHGLCKYYYPNGKLEKEENYYNNENHGINKYYDTQGKLKQTLTFYYGTIVDAR